MELPKRSESQITGNEAELYLEKELCPFFNVLKIPGGKDIGIDFYCERIDSNRKPTGKYLAIQCKGTKDNSNNQVQIRISTINYWRIQPFSVVLCLVNLITKKIIFCFPVEQLRAMRKGWEKQKQVTIRIDKNKLLFAEPGKLNEEFESYMNLSSQTSLSVYYDYAKGVMESFKQKVEIEDIKLEGSDEIPYTELLEFYNIFTKITKMSLEYSEHIILKISQILKKLEYIMMAIEYDCPFFRNPNNKIGDIKLSNEITPNIAKRIAQDTINKYGENPNIDSIIDMVKCYAMLCDVNHNLKWCREIYKDKI